MCVCVSWLFPLFVLFNSAALAFVIEAEEEEEEAVKEAVEEAGEGQGAELRFFRPLEDSCAPIEAESEHNQIRT